MLIQTILKKTLQYKGFSFGRAKFGKGRRGTPSIEVEIFPKKSNQPICSGCGKFSRVYDHLKERLIEHIPFWGFLVFFCYSMRRVDCTRCGVVVERVPWVNGKHHLSREYSWYLSGWCKRLSIQEAADAFRTTWHHVFCALEMAVEWGRAHMDLTGIRSIGIDEILWRRGRKFLTMVYQIDNHRKRLLWVGKERTVVTIEGFFKWFGKKKTSALHFICSDMWKPYLKIVAQKAKRAIHILDRFHIMSKMNEAIDDVRSAEVKQLAANGETPILKHSRWIWLKRPENHTAKENLKLSVLLKLNLKTIRSYLLKMDFYNLWEYVSPYWAGKFLDKWCDKVMRSRIEPMKKFAKTMHAHRSLILNWFKAKGTISSGAVEGLNNKAKISFRRAYGFRTFRIAEIVLYHSLGDLLEFEFTHKFF